jgi:putative methyltransferase (TIGR04325 family)
LYFYESVHSIPKKKELDLVLVSSTLQYLEKPYDILDDLIKLNPRFILLDRLLIVDLERELITKQTVRSFTYEASYPCRFLVKDQIINFVTKDGVYELVSDFVSYVFNKSFINHRYAYDDIGLLFRRINY